MNPRIAAAVIGCAIAALAAGTSSLHASDAPGRALPPAEALAARPSAAVDSAPAAFHMAPLSTYSEVLSRPLFASDRRAHEAPSATAALPQSFTLRGIVVLPAATYAVVEEGKTSRRVREGEALGGGTVKQILHDRVVLDINGVDTAVKLFDPTATDKPAPRLSAAGGFPSQLPPGFQPPAHLSGPH